LSVQKKKNGIYNNHRWMNEWRTKQKENKQKGEKSENGLQPTIYKQNLF